jgi:hypothetical protein
MILSSVAWFPVWGRHIYAVRSWSILTSCFDTEFDTFLMDSPRARGVRFRGTRRRILWNFETGRTTLNSSAAPLTPRACAITSTRQTKFVGAHKVFQVFR